jgi:enoyl-CoA hydratase
MAVWPYRHGVIRSPMTALPDFQTILLQRDGRLLRIIFNRPDALNAFNLEQHNELPEALAFARDDAGSDVILLTGAGRAFSAGGDIAHIERNAADPKLFDHEVEMAKAIIFTLLDIDKPVVCRMNGHAVGLGATLALFCDVIFAADNAKIGDPHVGLGLVAGDGGAVIWPQLIGLARAKEYLLTGDLIPAPRAAEMGLINYALPADELDAAVDAFCAKLLAGAQQAIRWTKKLTNIELKRVAEAVVPLGLDYECQSVRTADHLEGINALKEKRKPYFGQR